MCEQMSGDDACMPLCDLKYLRLAAQLPHIDCLVSLITVGVGERRCGPEPALNSENGEWGEVRNFAMGEAALLGHQMKYKYIIKIP